MNKLLIDLYFTTNYKIIERTIKSKLWKNGNYNVIGYDNLMSNLYLYIISKQELLTTRTVLESYIFKYISNESYWTNGFNYKEERLVDKIDVDTIDVVDYNDSIEAEIQYNNYRFILASFKQSLINQDAVLYDLYINRGIRTCKSLGLHLGISKSSASILMKDFRIKMKDYIDKNKLTT